MTYAAFKRLDIYKMADVVEIFDEDGIEIDDNIPEEELDEWTLRHILLRVDG